MNSVAGALSYLEGWNSLGPSMKQFCRRFALGQEPQRLEAGNACHRDSQSYAIVVRRTGAFEFFRAVPKILGQLHLSPFAQLGRQLMAHVPQPGRRRLAKVWFVTDDMDPRRKMVSYAGHLQTLGGTVDQFLNVSECRGSVRAFREVRDNPLAQRLAEIHPHPNLAALQIDVQFGMD